MEGLEVHPAQDLAESLLPDLICPVCHFPPQDPESWCPHGHILCQACHDRLPRLICPMCSTPLNETSTKNLTMRQLMKKLNTQCPDCEMTLSLHAFIRHPDTCLGRPTPCLGSKAFYQYHALKSPSLHDCLFKAKNMTELLAHNELHQHTLLIEAGQEVILDRHDLLFYPAPSGAEAKTTGTRTALMNVINSESKEQYMVAMVLNIQGGVFAIQFFQYQLRPILINVKIVGEISDPYILQKTIAVYHTLALQRAPPHVFIRKSFNFRISIPTARTLSPWTDTAPVFQSMS